MESEDNYDIKMMNIDSSKLHVKHHIADGFYGSVYKGDYDGRSVAIKVMKSENGIDRGRVLNDFIQEVSVWNNLDHPNVAHLIGATRKGESEAMKIPKHGKNRMQTSDYFIVVEYLGGGTLRSYLRKHRTRKLPVHVVIKLALDIAKGLAYLHSQKIVHRDIKPENIILDDTKKTVKIVDFGVSAFEGSEMMTGGIGTVGYMAPEVVSLGPHDHKCDVFSFGICLLEIFSCELPMFKMSCRPEIPKSCPEDLAKLMKDCWDADPKRRPEMGEVVRKLEAMHAVSIEEGAKKIHCFNLGF